MNPSSISARDHETRLAKRTQMVRHERLAESRRVHQVGNGALASREQFEETEARLVAQCAESECGHGAGAIREVSHGRNINTN
jgi:hypothetical protein